MLDALFKSSEPSMASRVMDNSHTLVDLEKAVDDPLYALAPFFRLSTSSELRFWNLVDAKSLIRDLDEATPRNRTEMMEDIELFNTSILYLHQHASQHTRCLQLALNTLTGWSPWVPRDAQEEGGTSLPRAMTWPSTDRPKLRHHKLVSKTNQEIDASANAADPVVSDLRYTHLFAELFVQRCEHFLDLMSQQAAMEEARFAAMDTNRATQLTRLATFFVPLALITSVFGMNVRELGEEEGPPLWLWAVVSVAVVIGTMLLMSWNRFAMFVHFKWKFRRGTLQGLE
jgi:Mg2+ and Co2+ transporter CorA